MAAIFIHLSDIHFGQESDGGTLKVNNDAKERLINDAAVEIEGLCTKASGVVVTGDIAFAGKEEQYVEAGEWLDRLTAKIGCTAADIQMVPGNHDIDRDAISHSMRWMLESIRDEGEATLNQFLDNDSDREVLFQRFAAYRRFADAYESPLDCAGDYSADGAITLADKRIIRFVRLNSALICSGKDDEGRLILGARQRVLPICDGEEVVVLTHHPLNWFQDSADAAKYIRARARVLMSGHEHFPSLEVEQVEEGRDLMLLAAGSTAPDEIKEGYTYKYNIIAFEWDRDQDALAVTLNPRTWDDEMKRFKRDDEFLGGRDPRCVLASPNYRKAPLPASIEVAPLDQQDRPLVEPVANPIVGGDEPVPSTSDERLLQLRFFRDMTEGERLKALVDLGAIPHDMREQLDHEMERRLFKRLLRNGHGEALEAHIDAAVGKRRGGDAA